MTGDAATSRSDLRARRQRKQRRRIALGVLIVAAIVIAVAGLVIGLQHRHATAVTKSAAPTTTSPPTSTTSPSTTTTTQAPGPGFVAGKVTAIGDSVMLDYQQPLEQAVPGITVDAAVSRQWSTGEQILAQLKEQGQLGATVVVALSTNGPISDADFDSMMSTLSGASKVVFVNTHVDQPWQDPNNQVLASGVARYPNTTLVDWYSLASANPEWFGPDETHLAIDGAGTQQLAALIAKAVSG